MIVQLHVDTDVHVSVYKYNWHRCNSTCKREMHSTKAFNSFDCCVSRKIISTRNVCLPYHTDPACLPVCQTGPVVVVPEWLYSVMHCLRCHGDSQLWTTTTPLPLPYLLLFQTGLLLYSLSRIKTRLECISIDCWRDYGIRPPASLPAHSNDMWCRLQGD